jgi:hypothetical protein
VPIDALPLTDLDLAHESRTAEDENLRFSMPVSVLGRLRKKNRGGKAFKVGEYEVSHLRGQGIELVNLGEAGRVKQGELGHWICSVCGAAKAPYAVPAEVTNFLSTHKERCGKEPARPALAVQAEVGVLQFHDVEDEATGINIGEALRTAASRLLDKGARTISRSEHEGLIEELRERMQGEEARALYRLREQTVERANADLKAHRGLRRLSGRGLKRAGAQVRLAVLGHNLVALDGLRRRREERAAGATLTPPGR